MRSATPWMHDEGFDRTVATIRAIRDLVGTEFDITHARSAGAVDVPIAPGEQEYTAWRFGNSSRSGKLNILQPDVINAAESPSSPITLADTFSKPITVHDTQRAIGMVAHTPPVGSTPSCVYPQEYNVERNPLVGVTPIVANPLVPKDGLMIPNDLPDLGVQLDEGL